MLGTQQHRGQGEGPRKRLDFDGGDRSPHAKKQYSQSRFENPVDKKAQPAWDHSPHVRTNWPSFRKPSPAAKGHFMTTNQEQFKYLFGDRVK